MPSAIEIFSTKLQRFDVWLKDDVQLLTLMLPKGILYWARMPNGDVVQGIDGDGLNAIKGIIKIVEDMLDIELLTRLTALRSKHLQLLLNATNSEPSYWVPYSSGGKTQSREIHDFLNLSEEKPGDPQP